MEGGGAYLPALIILHVALPAFTTRAACGPAWLPFLYCRWPCQPSLIILQCGPACPTYSNCVRSALLIHTCLYLILMPAPLTLAGLYGCSCMHACM